MVTGIRLSRRLSTYILVVKSFQSPASSTRSHYSPSSSSTSPHRAAAGRLCLTTPIYLLAPPTTILVTHHYSNSTSVTPPRTPSTTVSSRQEEEEGGVLHIPDPPTTCCMSGCANCVWLTYAQELAAIYRDGGKAAEEVLRVIEDPSLKIFMSLELKDLQPKNEED